MKFVLTLFGVSAILAVTQALDLSNLVNGMLDNAIKDATVGAGEDDISTSNSGSSSSTSGSSGSSNTASGGNSNSNQGGNQGNQGGNQGGGGGLMGSALDQVLPAIKDFVVHSSKAFFDKLFGNQMNRNYHDDILLHRAVRIYKTGDASVVILDRTTGLKVAGEGATAEEAIESATKQLISTLLQTGQMSILDLGLQEPTKPTVVACVDNFGRKFCSDKRKRGFCTPGHLMATFTREACTKTCTGCK